MDVVESKLNPPENFPFPFTPYAIQKDFMNSLYRTLEEGKLGIYESPTGTGKSMSLICGTLTWLLDHENRVKRDLKENISRMKEELSRTCGSDGDDWLEAHARQAKVKQKLDSLQSQLDQIVKKEEKMESMRSEAKKIMEIKKESKYKMKLQEKKKKNAEKENKPRNENQCKDSKGGQEEEGGGELHDDDDDDDDVVLDDFMSESSERFKSDSENESDEERDGESGYRGVKVYFCSRTHSQLSQLVHEIRKSPFGDLNIPVVSMSSRQNYCINDDILKLKHLTLINERCQDLHGKKAARVSKISSKGEKLKKQKKSASSCAYYQGSNVENAKLRLLTEIKDVEETAHLGKEHHGCPYYATRQAVPHAQILLVPYNTILHESTRSACGIDLKDSVVIIDEAHNLLDAISNIHSCTVSGYHLICAHSQLLQYRDKYHDRFTAYNLLCLNQLIFILKQFIRRIGGKPNADPDAATGEENAKTTIETLVEFVHSCDIDTINVFKVLEFAKKSKLGHKLRGFVARFKPTVVVHEKAEEEKKKKGISSFLEKMMDGTKEKEAEKENEEESRIEGNPLLSILAFLDSLTNHSKDGRIVCGRRRSLRECFLKFLLLNPASHFGDVVRDARSVVLAGGTMQPLSEFTDQLFLVAGSDAGRIRTFTCGHVIDKNRILPVIATAGPTGVEFDFSYHARNDRKMLDELGRLLANVCNVVPAGVVCFFPSYEYENSVYQHLRNAGFISKLESKKKVLREPKKSNMVEEVLREYGKAAKDGALLFSVVGGKLSEGLNFNDDLGRCVIVVGLPYPNAANPELKEKMNYLDASVKAGTGNEYYENLCMKAVNQSIGRSVRHKDDYASVLLVDRRYSRTRCRNALPDWIKESLREETKFGSVVALLARFFAAKKTPRRDP